ncbi:MAG: hypothetical protein AAGA30_17465, partial [Planctomycetota bacterium]
DSILSQLESMLKEHSVQRTWPQTATRYAESERRHCPELAQELPYGFSIPRGCLRPCTLD